MENLSSYKKNYLEKGTAYIKFEENIFINTKITHYYQGSLNVRSSGFGRNDLYQTKNGQPCDIVHDFNLYNRYQDVKIYNVSLQSNIPYFERISYDTMYQKLGV